MKIGIDARTLETAHKYRGIGVYSKNLIKALAQIDHVNNYTFFCQSLPSPVRGLIDNPQFKFTDYLIRKTGDPSKYNWYLDQFYLPRAIKKSKVDLVHFLEQLSVPQIRPTKTIVSIMDHFQIASDKVSVKNKIKFLAAKNSNKIITISNYIKKELIKLLKIPSEKIEVTHLGYDKDIYKPTSNYNKLVDFRQQKTCGQQYLLYVGSLGDFEKRKNLDFLSKVFIKFAQINREVNLVMVGKIGNEGKRVQQIFTESGLNNRVIFTDYIPTLEQPGYFQAAQALLSPSLAEGFGLPPLEAMACGTPVMASSTSSLPEVVGQAGILLDPTDENLWVKSILNLINNDKLQRKLSQKGLVQADKFSWSRCAHQTLKVYQEVLNDKN